MSRKTFIEDGCPECGSKPEKWEFVNDVTWRQTDRMRCQVCGSVFDVDGSVIYPISQGSGTIKS